MTDPIADMLTRIRNAQAVKQPEVVIPFSKIKFDLAKILEKEGFVASSKIEKDDICKKIRVVLKYSSSGEPIIHELKKISKPGQRIYCHKAEIPRTLGGLGVTIISTSRGLKTDKEARRQGLGGEIICQVW